MRMRKGSVKREEKVGNSHLKQGAMGLGTGVAGCEFTARPSGRGIVRTPSCYLRYLKKKYSLQCYLHKTESQ